MENSAIKEAENQINEILNNLKAKIGSDCVICHNSIDYESIDKKGEYDISFGVAIKKYELAYDPDGCTLELFPVLYTTEELDELGI